MNLNVEHGKLKCVYSSPQPRLLPFRINDNFNCTYKEYGPVPVLELTVNETIFIKFENLAKKYLLII